MAQLDKNHPTFGLYFRRYAPFARFGRLNPITMGFGHFAGDNRGVSQRPGGVTSRTYGIVLFNRFGPAEIYAGSSGTHFHPAVGSTIFGKSETHKTLVRKTIIGADLFGFKASTAGDNPLIKGSFDLNTYVDVEIDFGLAGKMRASGKTFGDNFPNLEVFILCFRSSRSALLMDGQTSGGRNLGPSFRLPGASENYLLGTFSAELALDDKGELAASTSTPPTKLPG